jgi:hypothetical protein
LDQAEIFFSILQRKVLTPNDLTDLDALAERVLAFRGRGRYNAIATPFDWKFTRTDLDRIAPHEAAAQSRAQGSLPPDDTDTYFRRGLPSG